MSVRLEGMEKGQRAEEKLRGVIAFQLNSAAHSTEVIARELAAVDTGEMQSKVKQVEFADDNNLRSVTEAGADHSMFVEYGTVKMDAQPFMTPAFESAKRQLLSLRGIF